MLRFVTWLMALLRRERHEIGRKGLSDYLTRWLLKGAPDQRQWFLHCFHRGDAEPYFHDHPWPFWSLILRGGYWEHSENGKRWYGPGRLLRRPATWRHRVELPPGRKCWTLIWCGPRERTWGFWCSPTHWIGWRDHQASQDAGRQGCD